MKYIELEVRTALIVHGYDADQKEIVEEVNETDYVKKLISLDRLQSVSEQYVLVTSSHGRVMYWEYNCSMDQLKKTLSDNGLLVQ